VIAWFIQHGRRKIDGDQIGHIMGALDVGGIAFARTRREGIGPAIMVKAASATTLAPPAAECCKLGEQIYSRSAEISWDFALKTLVLDQGEQNLQRCVEQIGDLVTEKKHGASEKPRVRPPGFLYPPPNEIPICRDDGAGGEGYP